MIQFIANTIRGLVADIIEKANSGHPGMPLGTAELATVLYSEVLKHDPTTPEWADRDRFVLSAGHGSALLYALLHLTGYQMPMEELKRFRQLNSKTPGHPEYWDVPGIETTTGPLGQGLANAVGMAIAERMLAARFNRPAYEIIDHYTYVIAGDGCLMEGVTSEASSLAGDLQLGKLIVFYDDNEISIEGSTDLAFKEDVLKRYEAYGWQVLSIDGHEPEQILKALEDAKADTIRPTIIAAKTKIGKGSALEGSAKSHGAPLGKDNVVALKAALGLPNDDFYVSAKVYTYFEEKRAQWATTRKTWESKFKAWSEQYPELRADWDRIMKRELPSDLETTLPQFEAGSSFATRDAGGKVLTALSSKLPELVGGSADLSPSTKTYVQGAGAIGNGNFDGKNFHFGVREHAMGSILNGMSVHGGFRVYGSTFFVFSDYMRPPLRLAALMQQPVIYVFTHDSFYVGEDGPTHQPIEHIEALRIIPGMQTIRPADANETAWAWLAALKRTNGPTALLLTRHKVPTLAGTNAEGFSRGGYILREPEGKADLVLIATGSEVSLAVAAADELAKQGKNTRVVSMPCRELFMAQDPSYIDQVLCPNLPRVAIEAGIGNGWRQLTGPSGLVISLDRFGLSGPCEDLAELFGFTPQAVVSKIKAFLKW
ncbi:MAG TPA: transketolase [Firmicutes bacterium]|nr:transketolase [Bacillota bacterium]HBT15463.1 transketolase [Bacillota bacterium]